MTDVKQAAINRTTHTRWTEANSSHDLTGYEEFMHEDIQVHLQDGNVQYGIEEVRRGMASNIEAMPDYNVRLDDQVATEDRVICRWRVRGTPKATGRPVEVTGVSYWEFDGGKARRGWAYAGTGAGLGTLAQQIGSAE